MVSPSRELLHCIGICYNIDHTESDRLTLRHVDITAKRILIEKNIHAWKMCFFAQSILTLR